VRLLSVDLPWSSRSAWFGLASVDLSGAGAVETFCTSGSAAEAVRVVASALPQLGGPVELLLLDHPIAAEAFPGLRPVERAFANSAQVPMGEGRLRWPRFQPGGPHGPRGLQLARQLFGLLNPARSVVCESFPQLSVPLLLQQARPEGRLGLAAHKTGTRAKEVQLLLVRAFERWTGREVRGAAREGSADAVDALIALLPLLQLFAPRAGGPSADPVWLCDAPPPGTPLPGGLSRPQRMRQRAHWMSPLRAALGPAGVRRDGLPALRPPCWPEPALAVRSL
jgi:hypothetical protein